MLQTYSTQTWDATFTETDQEHAVNHLESGQILFFPALAFTLADHEHYFLAPHHADPRSKNIGYDAKQHKLWGVQRLTDQQHLELKTMMERYSRYAYGLIKAVLPAYVPHLTMARTSYRPVQVSNRKTSYRKDDKRLHVDAFTSAPNQGQRILRVFSNINPHGEDRVWRIGEPFENVAAKFLPQIRKPLPGKAALMNLFKITKSYRTLYDHYMLQMHNRMKADEHYQQNVSQQTLRLPPGSTWIVQTDHVSHAAMQGQYLLEQTFYLPVTAMQDETRAPLRVLERILQQKLV